MWLMLPVIVSRAKFERASGSSIKWNDESGFPATPLARRIKKKIKAKWEYDHVTNMVPVKNKFWKRKDDLILKELLT